MNVSIYQSAAALNASSRWQDVITQNLNSNSIPGFKATSFANTLSGIPGSNSPTVPSSMTGINFQQGELKYTGIPTNLAIDGEGFLKVRLPSGEIAYTRSGVFHVSAQGQLVTYQGYPLLGQNGPVQLDMSNPDPSSISISPDGTISQAVESSGQVTVNTIGQLKVTNFNNPQLLQSIGNGTYFLANDPQLQSLPSPDARLSQGYIESANTNSVLQMGHLLSSMRQFEANVKAMQAYDDRIGKMISEVMG